MPSLRSPSISGELTDTIVTEYGAAQIKGLSADDRARALIAIAAPEHHEVLQNAWERMSDREIHP